MRPADPGSPVCTGSVIDWTVLPAGIAYGAVEKMPAVWPSAALDPLRRPADLPTEMPPLIGLFAAPTQSP